MCELRLIEFGRAASNSGLGPMGIRSAPGRTGRLLTLLAAVCFVVAPWSVLGAAGGGSAFPPALDSYPPVAGGSLLDTLRKRVEVEPFNVIATVIFFLAIVHTFLAPTFLRWAHRIEEKHAEELRRRGKAARRGENARQEVSFAAEILHFFGEVEAIFGIWVVPLLVLLTWMKGWGQATDYLNFGVHFTEPMFVVVIMAIAGSRPILKFAERTMSAFAAIGKGAPAAWWFSILTIGPLLGSFITEPAAMTISALLLAQKFYEREPSMKLKYATLGLLFVNVSVGGTLTHFAAPPVLMVAGKWGWGFGHMLGQFGWKAAIGILISNLCFLFYFRKELWYLRPAQPPLHVEMVEWQRSEEEPVPWWITLVHLLFLGWVVFNNHYPVLFIGGFLFYLAFTQATQHHQFELRLRPPLLVGFFLAGLVIHGGLQAWWIEPVLSRLGELPLLFGAMILTAFNDNAAITYLASLVPGFGPELKYAVVAGAVAGGGLTVIANAPNPAGQSILARYFPDGVSPLYLFFGAAIPTAILAGIFLIFR